MVEAVRRQVLVTRLDYVLEGASAHAESLTYDGKTKGNRVPELDRRSETNPAYKANRCVVHSWLIQWSSFMKPYPFHGPTVIVGLLLP